MYCTSVGKVILSQMTDEEVEEILSREKKAFTDYTITDKEKLWRKSGMQERRLCYGQHGEYLRRQMCGSSSAESPGQSGGRHEYQHPFPSHDDEKRDIFVQILKRYANEYSKTSIRK